MTPSLLLTFLGQTYAPALPIQAPGHGGGGAGTFFLVFLLFAGLALVMRLIAGSFDGGRVEDYLRDQGFELIDRSWDPFGPGWFGEKDSRIYQIVYKDREGRIHRAHVKTSMLSGVYLTNDHIVEERPPQSVEEEKAALRRRLRELEERG